MSHLEIIQAPIAKEIEGFNVYFKAQFTSNVELLNSALSYVSESVGKMMRPMLVLLVAKSLGNVSDRAFAAASAMELLHSASLLHDDVIDESNMRRGRPSLNTAYNNNIAVLTGDFLFSQALASAAETGDLRIIKELAKLGKELSSGEVMQVELEQNGSYSEDNYFKVIYNKTASLFVCSTLCAVYSVGGKDEYASAFTKYGESVGICFQIKDDIFDYFSNDVGKPTGSDMREGKITLPALHVLNNSCNPLLVPIREKISNGVSLDENEIKSLIEISVEEGGVEYANSCIQKYRTAAIEALPPDIAPDVKDALVAYIDYVISRDK
ncbi:MAG: polyprenyl synthetase family protein [Bacteroidaceae bacterium]|nr:polyprenyl synthetase family protein [Bacteroidaceae bacterium]